MHLEKAVDMASKNTESSKLQAILLEGNNRNLYKVPDQKARDQTDTLVLSVPLWVFMGIRHGQSKDMR